MEQEDWMARFGKSIAAEIRRHRLARGMSAQQLSDTCAELGVSIPRTVISNIENGRRTNVSVAEILVLARALEVAPAALVLPVGYAESVEYLPGRSADPLLALDWWAGEADVPYQRAVRGSGAPNPLRVQRQVDPDKWAISVMRRHEALENRIRNIYRGIWEEKVLEQRNADSHEDALARETALDLARTLGELRREMARQGLVLPDLGTLQKTVDESERPPWIQGPDGWHGPSPEQ